MAIDNSFGKMQINTSKKKVIYNFILSFLGLCIPLIITIPNFINSHDKKNLVYTIFAFTIICILSLFKRKYVYLPLLLFSTLVFSLLSFIDVAHYLIFNNTMSSNTVYIVLESNKSESTEFIGAYLLRPKILFIGILYLLSLTIGFIFSFFSFSYMNEIKTFYFHKRYIPFIGLVICSFFLLKNRTSFLPYTVVNSFYEFQKEREEIFKISVKKNGNFKNVHHNVNIKGEKETVVIVIGESTTRTHMGLYGYNRNTNPLLTKRKDELFIFENVRSPYTHTIESLTSTLTLNDYSDVPSSKFNSTLVQLFNSANFNTYFISNQRPIGEFETTITLITKTSDKSVFTNTSKAAHDGKIIKPLKQILKEDGRKKFIMIHLMGTHLNYKNRYPSDYEIFSENPLTKFNHETAYKTINEYDNAVVYNDYIINSIIDELENDSSKSYMLYFSDHGEDVFETIDEFGHTETKGTEPMYKIPFILWCSDDYLINNKKGTWDFQRKYNNENFIHTVADLSSIKFLGYETSKSIINTEQK